MASGASSGNVNPFKNNFLVDMDYRRNIVGEKKIEFFTYNFSFSHYLATAVFNCAGFFFLTFFLVYLPAL